MPVRLTILGSGTSHGVPMIACRCPVCTSPDARDRRMRTSAVFTCGETNLLVDTGPELRVQCLTHGIERVDAVLYTHHHADHVVGLDDLRRFNWLSGGVIPVFGNGPTLNHLRVMFAYAFIRDDDYNSAKPNLAAHIVDGPFEAAGTRVVPLPYHHGGLTVFGYRVGDIAYCPDCSGIPDETRPLLTGLDVLVLGALRHSPHPNHFTLAQAVEEARRIGAKRTYFTHIAHEIGHAEANASLPAGMELAYDGLVCESSGG